MPLISGSKLGPYEIVAPIGAGGMGEVYRAHDTALGRDVAVKVIPAALSEDGDRLRRFKQEAQAAAALSHPNILTIFHVGECNGVPYIVSELLEGESLRQRLLAGALPIRKAIEYGVQVARGLAAAHDKGIVHRDLKPENIFLTRDGHAKILDFGLAKLTRPEESGGAGSDALTLTGQSTPGFVLGTVGYMSPEQVRGQVAGPASDLFSFGAVLFEIVTGKRAFRGETAADTMSAILKEDPSEATEINRQIPVALERIIRHCLEKNPGQRFESARDVAFDLESLSLASGTSPRVTTSGIAVKPKLIRRMVVALAFLATFAAGAFFAKRFVTTTAPGYRRITFRAGTIQGARFTRDAQSIVYSAAWEGNPPDIFAARPEGPESRAMGVRGSTLLAVSPAGELAVSLNSHAINALFTAGTLARLSLEGGAPREILDNVEAADWSRDGSKLLITRQSGDSDRLEFPAGKLIYQSSGVIGHPRLSPDGKLIAFFDHPERTGLDGTVVTIDLSGHKKVLSANWTDLTGLAWSPNGDEVWFTGDRNNSALGLFAVSLGGSERRVANSPGDLLLFDIARDGRVLLAGEDWRAGIYGLGPGETRERNLSWLDYSSATGFSADGTTVLFFEGGEGGGSQQASFVRRFDGSPAIKLSDGVCAAPSRDLQRVICITPDGQLNEVPIKTGEIRPLTHDQIIHSSAEWFPDERRILFLGQAPGQGRRLYVQDLTTGQAHPITPEGASLNYRLSPDGNAVAVAVGGDYRTVVYPVNGDAPRPVAGLQPDEVPIAWSPDNRFLYCFRLGEVPANVFMVEVATGRRTPWKKLLPPDPTGVTFVGTVFIDPAGKSYVYTFNRKLDALYLVDGLR